MTNYPAETPAPPAEPSPAATTPQNDQPPPGCVTLANVAPALRPARVI